jgi:bifunctional non-homologous end joining protein LigD
MPITWEELDEPELRPDRWTIRDVPERLRAAGDPFAGVLTDRQRLPPLG